MRIGVNVRFLLEGKLEGIGWFTFEVLKEMVKAHPEDEFIFFFDRDYSDEFVFAPNITPVILFPQARHPILWYWWFEYSIPKALKKYKVDVFLTTDGYTSLKTKVKTVLVMHDIAYERDTDRIPFLAKKYLHYFSSRFVAKADKVIAVSQYTKNDIVQKYGTSSDKITVAYNACRAIFQPLSKEQQIAFRQEKTEGKPYFFYVGAIHPRKNVHRLIQAFDQFKVKTQSDFQLVIGGRFAWETGVVKDSYDNAIHQKEIHFTNYLTEEELSAWMACAYSFVYVSTFEGFGIPVIEAMNCDVPVITSNVSSMPEVAGDAGILVDPFSVEEIMEAMKKISTSKDLRTSLIEKGRKQRQLFDWSKTASIIYTEIKKLYE